MKIYIKTFGCQMNENDSEVAQYYLEQDGFEVIDNEDEADVVLLNTCVVRKKAEDKFFSTIGELRKKNKKVGIMGCGAEKERENLFRRGVNFVIGTRAIPRISEAVELSLKNKKVAFFDDLLDQIDYKNILRRSSKYHAWITIIYGCNRFCTYCIVPYTRGREKSRKMSEILEEINNLTKKGIKEITFLGQNVDAYGKELIPDIEEKLKGSNAVERNVIEQNMWILGDTGVTKIGHRNAKWKDQPNAFTVLRANFDRWFAKEVESVGALIIPKTKVEDFIRDEKGEIIGVRTSRPKGDIYCKAVIIAEGVNPILTMKAGLRKEDLKPNMAAIAVKELISVPEDVVNKMFSVDSGQGSTIEILGSWSEGMFGMAFLYSNKSSISIGAGVLIEDIAERKIKPYQLLENLKNHPVISDMLGEFKNNTMEYMAHYTTYSSFF